jgi:hypothetical protein
MYQARNRNNSGQQRRNTSSQGYNVQQASHRMIVIGFRHAQQEI